MANERNIQITSQVNFFERRRRLRGLRKFYEEQDRLVELFREDERLLRDEKDFEATRHEENAEYSKKLKWDNRLALVVLVVNIVILGGNLTASILSGSYSVLSLVVDTLMDVVCSLIVQLTVWAIKNTNSYKYPRGRNRLELVAVIVSSLLMAVANVFMIILSVQAIAMNNVNPDANLQTILILASGITVKLLIMVVCLRHGSTNSKILALDQRNDILTSAMALVCAFVGDHFWALADPVGAIVVCTFIACSWFYNALEQVPMMVGKRAKHEYERRIQALAAKYDDRIKSLDHVMVYHVGEKAIVELHVVLDESLPLKEAHDISEGLQDRINGLEFVERTFVHVDYWCDGSHDGK